MPTRKGTIEMIGISREHPQIQEGVFLAGSCQSGPDPELDSIWKFRQHNGAGGVQCYPYRRVYFFNYGQLKVGKDYVVLI